MKHLLGLIPLFLLTLSASGTAARGGEGGGARFIVVFHDGIDAAEATADLAARHGVSADNVYQHGLSGFAGPLGAKAAQEISRDPRVKTVERDGVMSIIGQVLPTGIQRMGALAANTNGAGGDLAVNIAIIDTGVSSTHADLRVVHSVGFKLGKKIGGIDDNGHGSHCAGIAAARNNGLGVVGVAPGAGIWAIKVLGKNGSGWTSDIVKGVDYVTANKGSIAVANMSLGGGPSSSLDDAVGRSIAAGVPYTLAAGNESDDASNHSPARVPTGITVGALADKDGLAGGKGAATSYGPDDTFATFSNYGSVVDVMAPGVSIYSTYKGTGYATMSGTSMAAPHVAGAVALHKAMNSTSPLIPANPEWIPGISHGGVQDPRSYPLISVAGY